MRENSFTKKMSSKSNHELETIFEEKEKYTEEAIQAVIWELENRNLREKTVNSIKTPELKSEVANSTVPKKTLEGDKSPFEELVLPFLYSKKAIQGFTILFSTIFGAVLLMSNLKEQKKSKARIEVLIFGIAYTLISTIMLNYLPKMFFITLLFNIIGYTVLSEYFWNKYLGKDLQYRKKKIWKPIIISLLVTFIFVLLFFLPQILESQI